MFRDKKVLADLRKERGICYFDGDQIEKVMSIANDSIINAKETIIQASSIIKTERKNTKIITPMGLDESLYRRSRALSKIDAAKELKKESVLVLKREKRRLKALKRQNKKLSD